MATEGTVTDARRWWMLVCSMVAAMSTPCVTSGIAYLLPTFVTETEISLTTASTLAAVPTVGLMLAILPWGALLDRYGERLILIVSLSITLLGAVAAVAVALAATSLSGTALAGLTAALFVGGIGAGAANGASGRIVVGWFPAHRRGTAMGFRQMAQPLGIGLCALTMPALAAGPGIAAALVVPAVVTLIGLAACVFGVSDPPIREESTAGSSPSSSEQGAVSTPEAAHNPYRSGTFLVRVHGFSVLLVVPQSMLWTFVPTWLIVDQQWAPTTAGVLITVTQILGALGRIGAGRLSDMMGSRMRPVRIIAAVAFASMAGIAVADLFDSPIAIAVLVIASVATVADNGLAFTAIAEYTGPRWAGRGLAVQNTAQFIATAGTTPVIGAVIATAGFPAAFAVTALLPLLALPVVPKDAESRY